MNPIEPGTPDLSEQHELGGDPVPDVVQSVADGRPIEMVWRNELGGLTFAVGDLFVKWNPIDTGVDLEPERHRMAWLAERHPAPRVVDFGSDDHAQWLVTDALAGEHAVGDRWRARRSEAIEAIATGLRALHAVAIDDFPADWTSWVQRTRNELGERPAVDGPVLVHGDACAPNTLISMAGEWVGHVDLGDLTVGDRWADLAIASISLDWNFGEGHQDEFFDRYGVARDDERLRFYRGLWHLES